MNSFVNKHIKWVFSLPALMFVMTMTAVPTAMAFLLSLNDWNLLMGDGMRPNWGENYLDVLASRGFWQSSGITFYYMAVATVVEMLLGLAIALALSKDFWGKNGAKAVVLLSYMMAPVVVGLIWMLFYEPSSDLLNYIFTTAGLPRSTFVPTKQTVIPVVVAVEIWQTTPIVVIICLAGLSSLPINPMKVARVDGATPIQTFFQVTLLLLTQILFSTGLLRFIDTLKPSDLVYAMTKGGPANASGTLNLFAYEMASSYYRFDLSSTMPIILFVIVLLLSVLVMEVRRKLAAYYGG